MIPFGASQGGGGGGNPAGPSDNNNPPAGKDLDCLQDGVFSNDLASFDDLDLDECRQFCKDNQYCMVLIWCQCWNNCKDWFKIFMLSQFFNWYEMGQKCVLKSYSASALIKQPGVTSGRPDSELSFEDATFVGRISNADTPNECLEMCQNDNTQ